MHERSITFKKGLVDSTPLLEFMTQCHCQDLHPPRKAGNCFEEFHHLLFSREAFKVAPPALIWLRSNKYSQFQMLSCQEDYYHQTVAEEVPQDEIDLEAAGTFLEEAGWLDDYVATSWGLAEAQDRLDFASASTPRGARAGLAASVVLRQELNVAAMERIEKINVMSFSVVTGALQQYLDRKYEASMTGLVEQRLEANPVTMQTRIQGEPHIQRLSSDIMRRKVNGANWALRGILEAAAT